jgi:peptidoglycan/LPS O-acetylase OafA/YrhL
MEQPTRASFACGSEAQTFEVFLHGAMPRVRSGIVLALLAALAILHIAVISASESAAFRGATRWALLVFGFFALLAAAVPRLRAKLAAEPPPDSYLGFAKRWGPLGVLALTSLAALGTALAASFLESKEMEQAADATVFIFAVLMGVQFASDVIRAPTPQPEGVTWAGQFRVRGGGAALAPGSEARTDSDQGGGDGDGEGEDETSSAASAGSEEKE